MAATKEKVWLYADTENCDIVIDSFEIANHVGCQHKRVMDRIDSYVRNHPDESCHFILSRHEICKNRFCKAYSLTREGLRIYLQLRDEDAGRNSPKTIRGLDEIRKLLSDGDPETEDRDQIGRDKIEAAREAMRFSAGQISGIDKLYNLFRDEANKKPDPGNVKSSEEKCENQVKRMFRARDDEVFVVMETVYEYGDSRERNGYAAGFYMAFQIAMGLKDMCLDDIG